MTALPDVCPYRVDVIICCISLSHVSGQCFLKWCLTNRMCIEKYTCLSMSNSITLKTWMISAVINITRLLLLTITVDVQICLFMMHFPFSHCYYKNLSSLFKSQWFKIWDHAMCPLVYLCWLCAQSSFAVTCLLSRGTYCEKDMC